MMLRALFQWTVFIVQTDNVLILYNLDLVQIGEHCSIKLNIFLQHSHRIIVTVYALGTGFFSTHSTVSNCRMKC